MFRLASLFAILLLVATPTMAGVIIGPGNVPVDTSDGNARTLIAMDLTNWGVLGPDDSIAFEWGYQFSTFAGFDTRGTITPLLLAYDEEAGFIPIAIGESVTYTKPTKFITREFLGQNRFQLDEYRLVCAALLWTVSGDPSGARMPAGYQRGGAAYVWFNVPPPQIGVPVIGDGGAFFERTYNFFIEVLR